MSSQSPRLLYLLLGLASLFIIMFGIKATAFILNPILLAVVITIAVLPLPNKLTRRGLPGWLALVLTVLAVVGVLALTILLVVGGLSRLTLQLPTYAENIAARSTEFSAWLESQLSQPAVTGPPDSSLISEFGTVIIRVVGDSLVQVGMTLLIFIFMVSTAIALPGASRSGLDTNLPAVARVSAYTRDVRQYVNITTIINLLVGLGDVVLLLILGVDFAVLWGILSWIMGYIPTVGFWLALIPPTILAWAEHGPTTALIVFAGYVLINGSVQNFIQPKMMGDRLNISPIVVFLSLFIWGWLLGGIGAILAVPLTLLVLGILDSSENMRWLAALMRQSGKPEEDDENRKQARTRLQGVWDRLNFLDHPEEPEAADGDALKNN